MQRILVDRPLNPGCDARRRATRMVTINLAESPLGWLKARKLLDARQFEAGERLRADFERASLGSRVTMRWDAMPASGGRRAAPVPIDPSFAQLSARERFDRAIAMVGPGLADLLWRTVCACEPLPVSEKSLGWPARSGRVVLGIALDRLADAYGLRR